MAPLLQLSTRQADTLDIVRDYFRSDGHCPTLAEIAQRLEITTTAAHLHMCALVKKRYLRKTSRKQRSYDFTAAAREMVGLTEQEIRFAQARRAREAYLARRQRSSQMNLDLEEAERA